MLDQQKRKRSSERLNIWKESNEAEDMQAANALNMHDLMQE